MAKKLLLLSLLSTLVLSGCTSDAPAPETVSSTVEASEVTEIETPTTAIEETTVFDIVQYKDTVSEFHLVVTENMIALYNMGTYEYNYWSNLESFGGSPDFETLPATAFEWLSENSEHTKESVTNSYDSICDLYSNIIVTSTEGAEAEEIESLVKDIYTSYSTFYDLVTNPSGNIVDFATTFNDCVQALNQNTETLSLLLSK